MSELTKGQVQETATLIVESMQRVIDSLTEEVGLLETSLANATDRIEELTTKNTELRQRIARLEAGGKQTIYAWGTE
jgi:phage shock protein A